MLGLNIDYEDIGNFTGVDMHAHEVASHEIGLPMVQNDSVKVTNLVTDLGQLRDQQSLLHVMCQIKKRRTSK